MNVEGSKKKEKLEKKKKKGKKLSNAFKLCGRPSFLIRNHA